MDVFEDKSVVKLESQRKFWAWNWKEDVQVENQTLDGWEKSSKRKEERGRKLSGGRKFREDRDIWRDLVARQPTEGICTSKKTMVWSSLPLFTECLPSAMNYM